MSAPARTSLDPKALLQELKTNRKTQIALALLLLVLAFSIYSLGSDSPKPRSRGSARSVAAPVSGNQLVALQKLPNLAKLNQAGELPEEDRMYRDLFLFDMPSPPPVKVKPKALEPPPKPPTEAELAAQKLKLDRDNQMNLRPQTLHYLGYMGSDTSGRLGAFKKGEEPITIRLGDMANPQWKLQSLTETFAEFQNLKFPDMRYRIEAGGGKSNAASTPTNEF
jgi:hypothetical protein